MKVTLKNEHTSYDISEICRTITWSGNYQQCTRTVGIELIQSTTDRSIPTYKCDLGSIITLTEDETTIFEGYTFERQKHSDSSIINLTCYDKGIYLKRNQGIYKFNNITPEAITERICKDFGIEIGSIARTGIKLTRSFIGVNLYSILQTVYSIASQKNGLKYIIYFAGSKLMVREKKLNPSTLLIESGKNLMSSTTSESISNMINQVAIYNDNDKLVKIQKDQLAINAYGLMQSYLKQGKNEDVSSKADKLIQDNGVKQKITIENLGDIGHITGNTVMVKESVTGLYGLFMIDNDIHTWKNGQYYNKLVVNFNNLMDEQSAGNAIVNISKSSEGESGSQWEYLFKPGGE